MNHFRLPHWQMSVSQNIPDMKSYDSDEMSPRVQSLSASSTSDQSRSFLFGSLSSLKNSAEIPPDPESLAFLRGKELDDPGLPEIIFSPVKGKPILGRSETPEKAQSLTPSKMQMIVYPQEQISTEKRKIVKKKTREKDSSSL